MNNEGLNCVDMEQSDGNDDVEVNKAAAPSLNSSMISDALQAKVSRIWFPDSRPNPNFVVQHPTRIRDPENLFWNPEFSGPNSRTGFQAKK